MPASRWNSSILEMLNWLYEEQADLEELLTSHCAAHYSRGGEGFPEGRSATEEEQIPQILPILPLRGLVVYPQTAVP